MEIVKQLVEWVVAWANSPYGPAALFVIAFAESSFFPVPPDTLLIPLGIANPSLALLFALVCTVGSVIGGMFGYWIGIKGGRPVALKLFGEDKVMFVQLMYQRYDVWAIFIAAFTPIPYKVFTIAAGVFVLDFKRFVLASIVGRGARFFLVGGAIFLFGDTIQYLIANYFEVAVSAFTLLLIGGFLVLNYVARRFAQKEKARQVVEQTPSPAQRE